MQRKTKLLNDGLKILVEAVYFHDSTEIKKNCKNKNDMTGDY